LSSRFFFALLPVDDAAAVEEDDAVAADARSLASARADAAASGGGVAAGSLLLVQLPQASSARSADIDKTNSSIENSLLIFVCFFLSVKPAAGETGDAELGILAPKTGETPNWGRPAPKTGETNWGRKVAKTGEIPSSHLYYSSPVYIPTAPAHGAGRVIMRRLSQLFLFVLSHWSTRKRSPGESSDIERVRLPR
jgi:hypothetical protein